MVRKMDPSEHESIVLSDCESEEKRGFATSRGGQYGRVHTNVHTARDACIRGQNFFYTLHNLVEEFERDRESVLALRMKYGRLVQTYI